MRQGLDFVPQSSGSFGLWAELRETLRGLAGGGRPRRDLQTEACGGRGGAQGPGCPYCPQRSCLVGSRPARGLEGGNLTLKAGLGLSICEGRSRHMKTPDTKCADPGSRQPTGKAATRAGDSP